MRQKVYVLLFICFVLTPPVSTYAQHPRTQAGGASQNKVVPRFEHAPCVLDLPELQDGKADCGYLVVLEDRRKQNGQTIRLPIEIVKSSSPNPAPDPVLFTAGGPGGTSLKWIRGLFMFPYLSNRNVIILEQRGTQYAQPALLCPEVGEASADGAIRGLDDKASDRQVAAAAKACRARLIKSGVNPSAYNSESSAADIEDLRRVLGYEKWNLYGLSYSTRLMLNVVRDYPNTVRSMLLDTLLPPSVNYDETSGDGIARSLNVLFSKCAAEQDCASAYPNLKEQFYDLVRRANAKPIAFNVTDPVSKKDVNVLLKGSDIVGWIANMLTDVDAIPTLPNQIDQLSKGHDELLKSAAAYKLSRPGGYALGMRYSVYCSEEMSFEDPGKIAAQATRHPEFGGYLDQRAMSAVCKVWRVPRAPARENEPVVSAVPTLILSGEFDPWVPPAWGRLAATTLPRSYFYVFPWRSHGVAEPSLCARQMAAAFIINPLLAPNSDCLSRYATLKFKIE